MEISIFRVTENLGVLCSSLLNFALNLIFIVAAHCRVVMYFLPLICYHQEQQCYKMEHKLFCSGLDREPAILPWC